MIGNLARGLVVGGTTMGGLGLKVAQMIRVMDQFDYRTGQTVDVQLDVPRKEELDVSEQTEINRFVHDHGPWDYIVYAAGSNQLGWVKDIQQDDAMYDFMVNSIGFALLLGAHEDYFPGRSGSAVAIASDAGRNPMRGSLVYCSSKAALIQTGRCLARELAPRWRVNTVSPSIIEGTPMTQYIDETVPEFRGWDVEKMREYERTQLPLARRATVDEVAAVVVSTLFGPAYQTGSDVHVSGGK